MSEIHICQQPGALSPLKELKFRELGQSEIIVVQFFKLFFKLIKSYHRRTFFQTRLQKTFQTLYAK